MGLKTSVEFPNGFQGFIATKPPGLVYGVHLVILAIFGRKNIMGLFFLKVLQLIFCSRLRRGDFRYTKKKSPRVRAVVAITSLEALFYSSQNKIWG